MTVQPGGIIPPQSGPTNISDRDTFTTEIQLLLTEYDTLRQESLQAINNRIQIMNFGFTSLSVIIAGVLSSKISHWILAPVCLAFIPGAAKASVLILLGEYHRSQRAGRGVARIEEEVKRRVGDGGCLSWETGLNSRTSHMRYPYTATGFFILSIGYLSAVLGCYYIGSVSIKPGWLTFFLIAFAVLYAVISEGWFIRFARKKLLSIRSEAARPIE